jgi:hypothetical protein
VQIGSEMSAGIDIEARKDQYLLVDA